MNVFFKEFGDQDLIEVGMLFSADDASADDSVDSDAVRIASFRYPKCMLEERDGQWFLTIPVTKCDDVK